MANQNGHKRTNNSSNNIGIKPWTIMLQACPRLDSLLAAWFMLYTPEAERLYPGIQDARIVFWKSGTISPNGKNWKQFFEEDRTILIGVGGSPFDEHPSAEFGDRKVVGRSAASLVAEHLGLLKSKLYGRLIEDVTKADLTTGGDTMSLSNVIKLMYRTGMEHQQIISWAFRGIEALIENQREFLNGQIDFAHDARWNTVEGPKGAQYRVAQIMSDNMQIATAARTNQDGPPVAVNIVHRSTGHVQIFGNQRFGVKLDRVAKELRRLVLVNEGREAEAKEHKSMLKDPGQLEIVPQICYQMPGDNILNGSETAPDVKPLELSDDVLMEVVLKFVRFEVSEKPAATKEPSKELAATVN